ncbi:hypothetical protein BGX26_012403 [Mortierella sp. AD094]|nr:hypothetical protein BGX26_012403 [Mortierella sp. AD094]
MSVAYQNTVKFAFTGTINVKLVYCTINHCRCDTCMSWINCETIEMASGETYGILNFKDGQTQSFSICCRHVVYIQVYDDRNTPEITGCSQLNIDLIGSHIEPWVINLKVNGVDNKLQIDVDSADEAKLKDLEVKTQSQV